MRYIFALFILIVVSVIARENPFKAVETSATIGKATYKKDTMEHFTSVKVQLPSSARVLKSVEFHYQNLDGSIESKKVNLNQKIDWHDELIVKKLVDDIDPLTTSILTKIKTDKKTVKKVLKKINFKNLLVFTIDDKSLYIKTKDKKIRDFLITEPYKIVVDFKREISFYTKVYNLKTRYFKTITIGKHSGYYRVAIELDGKYLYKQRKVKDGYVFTLR